MHINSLKLNNTAVSTFGTYSKVKADLLKGNQENVHAPFGDRFQWESGKMESALQRLYDLDGSSQDQNGKRNSVEVKNSSANPGLVDESFQSPPGGLVNSDPAEYLAVDENGGVINMGIIASSASNGAVTSTSYLKQEDGIILVRETTRRKSDALTLPTRGVPVEQEVTSFTLDLNQGIISNESHKRTLHDVDLKADWNVKKPIQPPIPGRPQG